MPFTFGSGLGSSAQMGRDLPWTLHVIIGDYLRLLDTLGVELFHLVAAKIGGTIARALAARHADRVRTLTVMRTPPPRRKRGDTLIPTLREEFEQHGVEH